MELYAWQRKCLEKWKNNGYRGIADVVTGAGKTVLALECARLLSETYSGRLRVRIVVPTRALASQWAKAVRRSESPAPEKPARISMFHGAKKDDYNSEYTIYVINSARYALARHILKDMEAGYHVFLIADECHHYAGAENRKIFDFLGQTSYSEERYHCLGLTATPRFDEGGRFLELALGKEIYHYRFREAVSEGTVSRFFIYQIGLSFLAAELEEYTELSSRMHVLFRELESQYPRLSEMGKYEFFRFLSREAGSEGEDSPAAVYISLSHKRAALSQTATARVSCVCELIRQLDASTRILVFCERIDQAESLLRQLRLSGIRRVGSYHSHLPRQVRKRALDDFRDGEIRILVACRALDEGLDVPDAVVGIVMSGSSMTRQRIQRIGRLLRCQADKPWACIYYLYVKESAEDSIFLAEYKNPETVCSLSYDMNENIFIFPDYEKKAARLLEETGRQKPAGPILRELRRCLLRGVLRPDWLTGADELQSRIRAENDLRERNYLLSMKRLAEQ